MLTAAAQRADHCMVLYHDHWGLIGHEPLDSGEMCSEHLEDKGTMEGSCEFLWNHDILSIHLICEIKQGPHFRVISIWVLIQEMEMLR